MSTKELRGKSVRCVSHTYGTDGKSFTVGKIYPIEAVAGDDDPACGGIVLANGYILTADNGEATYHIVGGGDAHGVFEVVE